MSIMSYKEWKSRTSAAFKPRSKELKYLDACIKEYDRNRGSRPHFDTIVWAYQAWVATKTNSELSVRNKNGAVSDLLAQIVAFRDAHMPFAHQGGSPLRSNALLRDIKEGAKLLGEGKLKPQVKVHIPEAVVDSGKGKGSVVWEDFEASQLTKARKGWSDAFDAAKLAYESMLFKIGNDTNEQIRFQRWFGNPTREAINTVREGTRKMWKTFQTSPVTIVLHEDIILHYVQDGSPFGEMEEGSFGGKDVYGYVWNHKAGSGYRVIMGQWFLADPDPIDGAAETVYHELSHKVLGTVDHIYGKIQSRGLAASQQRLALTNADNWAWFAMSFLKYI
ncbi:MAG: M35 family metallo-endopeptidase [Pyrinomonadaceae bacterium]